jgi:hypothetical protein
MRGQKIRRDLVIHGFSARLDWVTEARVVPRPGLIASAHGLPQQNEVGASMRVGVLGYFDNLSEFDNHD